MGWYERGPTPGQFGPAIIVGHADTRTGPSVFHDWPDCGPGTRMEVTRQDRSVAIFEVNSVERFERTRCRRSGCTATTAGPDSG